MSDSGELVAATLVVVGRTVHAPTDCQVLGRENID